MKKVLALVLALCMSVSLCACGTKETAKETSNEVVETTKQAENNMPESKEDSEEIVHLLDSPMTIKVATTQSATGIWVTNMEKAYAKITELTNGDLQFEIYPSSELGSNIDCVEQILAGAPMILGCGFDTMTDYSDKLAVASSPYVFQDSSEVFDLAATDWWTETTNELAGSAGIKIFAVGTLGYRHFISTKAIRSVSDIPTMIVRMGSALMLDWITVMGGSPTSSTWSDNYTSMDQGIFDACEATLDLLWSSSLYEVCDYLTLSGHSINPNISIMSTELWDSIPTDYQQTINEVMIETMDNMYDDVISSEQSYIDQFKEAGVEIIEVDKSEFAEYTDDLLEYEGMDGSILEGINTALGR
ncbi:MAG: TRAP transporter substrate-binding protein DctP [Clostridiales bacterium]|nr:TRAP transporter substrate-binding protein DctP [Clostridiales bacterium]